jgi:hypothetical protein
MNHCTAASNNANNRDTPGISAGLSGPSKTTVADLPQGKSALRP